MSRLIAVKESGDQLTEDEIVSTCNLLLIAGHETTVNLIANAILAMLRNPAQWAALGADADRASAVVEETLRYDPPVQLVVRIAADDMTIGDTEVVKGDTMMLLLAAAQRDPSEFDRPEVFDPDRETFRHLAFGRGAALLPGRAAGPAGGRRGAVGGDGAFPRRATGRRAGLQAERQAARTGDARRRGLRGLSRVAAPDRSA